MAGILQHDDCDQLHNHVSLLIQRLPVPFYSDRQNDEGKERDLPKLKRDVDDTISF